MASLFKISVIYILYLIIFKKKKTMVVKNKYEFEIYFIYTSYRNNTFILCGDFLGFFTSGFFNNFNRVFWIDFIKK